MPPRGYLFTFKNMPVQLARKGMNIVLISRSLFKLQTVAREIGELLFESPMGGRVKQVNLIEC